MNNLYKNTAWLYDIDNRDIVHDDISFYIEYAQSIGGEVLELGCGTGRVAIALANKGINVTGIDLSPQMLDVFKKKIGAKDRITILQGDMSDFSIDKKFGMIISPFRAFQSLTRDDDIINSLHCIHNHLSDNGIFIINVFKPNKVLDESWCYTEKIQWERRDESTGNYVIKKHYGDKIDTDNQIIYPHFIYEVTGKNGTTECYTEDLNLKYYYENQLEDVLMNTGFKIIERYGWYDKRSVEEANRELIFICKKKSI